jgi:hypothetical protein
MIEVGPLQSSEIIAAIRGRPVHRTDEARCNGSLSCGDERRSCAETRRQTFVCDDVVRVRRTAPGQAGGLLPGRGPLQMSKLLRFHGKGVEPVAHIREQVGLGRRLLCVARCGSVEQRRRKEVRQKRAAG